ncbi:MAG: hypothetical protein DI586_03830 [Micavibrio aeruginosavorus]|uniref:SGNH hydrolase-type esterase domain-containing protein n=1 Tax=Micavibrio aeruginosavorus TaxID=349221 RepID=A0A2W5HL28_9BACT|nr:MAG: hypothetical protein DI586_03830 [Micavibrio aeruginosavorus]
MKSEVFMSERIICLGDSITEGIGDSRNLGWPGRLGQYLAEQYPDKWHINNLGVAGDTSFSLHHRLLSEVLYRSPRKLIIAGGVNDTIKKLWPEGIGSKVDINQARVNWASILEILKKLDIETVFIGQLPVDETMMPLIYMPADDQDQGIRAYNDLIKPYNQMLGKLVRTYGYTYVDLFDEWQERDYAALLCDGLHPNAEGYDMLAGDMIKACGELSFFK